MNHNSLLVTFAQPNPEEIETFQSYVQASTVLAVDAGGEVSSRFGVQHLHGDAPASVFGLATFPDTTVVTDMFDSDEYQALVPARDASLESVNAYVVDDPALTALPDLEDDAVYLVTVAAPNPDNRADLATYQQVAGPLAAKHGGQPVAQLLVTGRPVGDTPAAFVAVAQFPSSDAVSNFFADDDYLAVVDVRDRALRSLNLYLASN